MQLRIVIIYLIGITTFFSCNQNRQENTKCIELEKKYDSILTLKNKHTNTPFVKFYEILKRENGTVSDSILISEYKAIESEDSLLNLYIWDRVHTINQNTNKLDIIEEFKGTYTLKSNHNKKNALATKVQIKKDSCFIYNGNDLMASEKIKLTNSSDEFIKAKIRIGRYKVSLLNFANNKLLIVDDNLCVDCETLQFNKIN